MTVIFELLRTRKNEEYSNRSPLKMVFGPRNNSEQKEMILRKASLTNLRSFFVLHHKQEH